MLRVVPVEYVDVVDHLQPLSSTGGEFVEQLGDARHGRSVAFVVDTGLLSFGFRMRAVGTESAGQGAVAACREARLMQYMRVMGTMLLVARG